MSSQEDVTEKGGTMRLGAYPCKLAADTLAREAYGEELVYERHRHRFEFNNAFRDQLEDAGLVISGLRLMSVWSRWSSCRAMCTRGSWPPSSPRV